MLSFFFSLLNIDVGLVSSESILLIILEKRDLNLLEKGISSIDKKSKDIEPNYIQPLKFL